MNNFLPQILLAPMAGITDSAFRSVCLSFGAELTYTEMISAKGMSFSDRKTLELLSLAPKESITRPPNCCDFCEQIFCSARRRKKEYADIVTDDNAAMRKICREKSPTFRRSSNTVAVQQFGHEPEILAQSAARTEQILGENLALIDLNFGCPVPKIVKNGDGSALMREPTLAGEIIKSVKKAVKVPVTAKFRLGIDGDNNYIEFAKILEDSGADALCLHPRTREQMYAGKSDRTALCALVKSVNVPVVASGDVYKPEDIAALRQLGCGSVMVARGALGNPFIFRQWEQFAQTGQYSTPDIKTRMETLISHAKLAFELKGERAAVEMRKHAAWYIRGVAGGAEIRKKFMACGNIEELCRIASEVI